MAVSFIIAIRFTIRALCGWPTATRSATFLAEIEKVIPLNPPEAPNRCRRCQEIEDLLDVDLHGIAAVDAVTEDSYFEVFPFLPNGSLGAAVIQIKTLGNVGPKKATSAPPGSFAISAHEGRMGTDIDDPSNRWVLGSDAGQDRIYVWKLTMGATAL